MILEKFATESQGREVYQGNSGYELFLRVSESPWQNTSKEFKWIAGHSYS